MKIFLVIKGVVPAQLPCSTNGSYPGTVLKSDGDMSPFLEQLQGRETLEQDSREGLADNGIRSETKKQLVPTFPIRYATIRFWNIRNTKKA
jgi:hypothetical protein